MAEKTPVTPAKNADRDKMITAVMSQIEREFGKGSIMRLGDNKAQVDIPTISTGALSLDIALGVGGLPRGRIVEIYGPESSGKTTLCLHVIANAQRAGGVCAIIDAEHAVDPSYAKKIGVDLDNLLISQPDCGEDALTIMEDLVKSGAVDVIVIDSVAALVPKAELEGQMGDAQMGLQARLMSQAMRKLTGILNRSKTCAIFTNQIRQKIGIMFGNPETTTGGNALKFYASVRLDIRRIGQIKDTTGEIYGTRARVKVVKNKLAPPFKEAEFDITYAEGISRINSILDVAIDMNVVEKRGSWLSFNGEQIAQGREGARKALLENQELTDKVLAGVRAKLQPKDEVAEVPPAPKTKDDAE